MPNRGGGGLAKDQTFSGFCFVHPSLTLYLCPISTSLQTLLPFTLNGIHRFYCPSFRVKANIPGFSHGGRKLHQSGTQLQL